MCAFGLFGPEIQPRQQSHAAAEFGFLAVASLFYSILFYSRWPDRDSHIRSNQIYDCARARRELMENVLCGRNNKIRAAKSSKMVTLANACQQGGSPRNECRSAPDITCLTTISERLSARPEMISRRAIRWRQILSTSGPLVSRTTVIMMNTLRADRALLRQKSRAFVIEAPKARIGPRNIARAEGSVVTNSQSSA